MKYMILSFGSQQDYDEMAGGGDRPWTGAEVGAMVEFMTKLNNDLEASGELVETRGLAAPVHTRRIGRSHGDNVVTDGPYAETQEVLAGYWVVECDSFDRATEIASMLGDCPAPAHVVVRGYADVRPIAEGPVDDIEV
ncbi:MAG TPA: YciI family protein [Stackebrandtia sp.]|jgi:hypothetical protein|uniref:YciI family protein n=1 Tax=Stackebrandtia sp. TaxID=2023065 RepID=UPI002D2CD654|nr:YciI family protein [Stackebrandtia sp.]HZE40299.1 YciI family protein [Stackebrandtia sp.]